MLKTTSHFNRVVFDITTDNSLQKLPTDKRLEAVKKGRLDLELQETLFHFGRYLLISSSREGTLAKSSRFMEPAH